ncbi:uncharacterized protein JCM6883_001272 [Sporobolomyces salmoneus]|uniref:uncharacterized protein n=1 Tax=Sporobolomyces salmoneus TaxID=183962 RepID=UPI00317FE87D
MSFPTPRKPSLRTQQDTLDGEEVLEITLFAEKKEWIEEKITFLSTTLPQIVVHDPLPPLPSTTTKPELEEWWIEHESIEREVHEYDYGDLNKMRLFAKQKSKQQLSRRDTDLIEVCLGTIFALDKLLSLLRQRRKSLVLLEYRLQWEESLRTVWTSHQRLLCSEIPLFLSQSTFTPPPTSSLSLNLSPSSSEDPNPSLSLSKSLSSSSLLSTSSSSSSITHSRRRRRLSSLSSPSSHSRTLRSQTLLLSLSSLKSHLYQLLSTLLPASGTWLDKLIDASNEPLPEEFLDGQDRVEDTVRNDFGSMKGGDMVGWLEARIEGWRKNDQVFESCQEGEREREEVREETEKELGKLRISSFESEEDEETRKEWVEKFEERLNGIGEKLGQARRTLEEVKEMNRSGRVPGSVHRLFPEHLAETQRCTENLEEYLRKTSVMEEETKRMVEGFRKGVETVSKAEKVRNNLNERLRNLKRVKEGVERLGEPPGIGTQDFDLVEAEEEESNYRNRCDSLLSTHNSHDTKQLVKEGYGVIAQLGEIGIDPNSRREVKQLIEGVEESRKEVERLQAAENARRKRVEAVRETKSRVRVGRQKFDEMRTTLRDEAERAKWEEGKELGDSIDLDLTGTIRDIKARCTSSLSTATAALGPQVHSKLNELVASLSRDLDYLIPLEQTVNRTRAQTSAVKVLEEELDSIRNKLNSISQEAQSSLEEPRLGSTELSTTYKQLKERLLPVRSLLSPLIENIHLRIPFLSTSSSSSEQTIDHLLPFDLNAHDERVKLHVNTLVARLGQEREETRRRIDLVSDASAVKAWDEDWQKLEGKIEQIDRELGRVEEQVLDYEDDFDIETRLNIEASLREASTALGSLPARLSTLSTSLKNLESSVDLSRLPPSLKEDRQESLNELESRVRESESRIGGIRGRIERFKIEREEKVKRWEEDLKRIVEALETQCREIEAVKEAAKDALTRLEVQDVTLVEDSFDEMTSSSGLEKQYKLLDSTTSTVTSLVDRLRTVEDTIAASSNDLSALTTATPSSKPVSREPVSAQTTIDSTRLAHQQAKALVNSVQESLDSYRDKLAKLETERAHRLELRRIEERRRQEAEAEEVRKLASRLALAQSIALPSEEQSTQAEPLSFPSVLKPQSSQEDVFGTLPSTEPFPRLLGDEEPVEISDLRAKVELLQVRDWLDSQAILRLPSQEESKELRSSLRVIKRDLQALGGNRAAEEELEPLRILVSSKETEVHRVSSLADFSTRVEAADSALSNLLDAIDAATPGFPSPSPTTLLPLSEAISQASDSVDGVRLAAIRLIDDARVEQAMERIEESWSEMTAMVDEVRPRSASSRTSSRSSSTRTSRRIPSSSSSRQHAECRSMSRSSSSSSSTASLSIPHSRPSSRSTTPILFSRSPSLRRSISRSPSLASMADDPLATPRRRNGQSSIPVPTPRRNNHASLPPMTPTTARPFSFSSASKIKPPSITPFRTPSSTPRKSSTTHYTDETSSSMMRSTSGSSRASLASSTSSSRRSSTASTSYHRPSLSPENLSRIGYRSSPPRQHHNRPPQYRANLSNKLDREVGTIVNALDIHVPIAMADGSWSDESGMYKIGDKVYFCRILRSKNVMVRVGGGWLNLLQFIITHFAPADKINISPTTPVKRTLGTGNEPQWISSNVVRDQLKPTPSSSYSSLRSHLASSVSSHGSQQDDNHSLSGSISMRRSISSSSNVSTPLRRSIGSHQGGLLSPTLTNGNTPRQHQQQQSQPSRRPAIPIWRP